MADLQPEDILAPKGQYNRKPREMAAMLGRYGFNLERSGTSSIYTNPKYPEIIVSTANFSGIKVVDAGAAVEIAKACMDVKRLNAERADRGADKTHVLPDWLEKGFPAAFESSVDDERLTMTATHAANGSAARSYTIRRDGKDLMIQSNDFPEQQIWSPIGVNDRMPAKAFKHVFEGFDQKIVAQLPTFEVEPISESVATPPVVPSGKDSLPKPRANLAGSTTSSLGGGGDFSNRVPKPVKRSRQALERMVDERLASNGPNDGVSFADALMPSGFIAPALAKRNDSSQPQMEIADEAANNVKDLLLEIAKAADRGDSNISDTKENLREALGAYVAGLKIIPHMQDSHDNGHDTFGYVVVDPAKYQAAIALEGSIDKMVNAMQPQGRAK